MDLPDFFMAVVVDEKTGENQPPYPCALRKVEEGQLISTEFLSGHWASPGVNA